MADLVIHASGACRSAHPRVSQECECEKTCPWNQLTPLVHLQDCEEREANILQLVVL